MSLYNNHRGDVIAVSSHSGGIVFKADYDAYGKISRIDSGSFEPRYTFSTKKYFKELGLYYYGYRWYLPELGRWTKQDPLSYKGGQLNLYTFCKNNPVHILDPYGLATVRVTCDDGSGATFVNPTGERLRNYINGIPDGSISEIEFVGHGTRGFMYFNEDGGLILSGIGDVVFTDDAGTSFTDLIKGKLATDASIYLHGCNTASELRWWDLDNDHITHKLSQKIPGANIYGTEGIVMGIHSSWGFTEEDHWLIGRWRKYQNGKQIDTNISKYPILIL